MSTTLPPENLPAVTLPPSEGALAKPSRGSLSSEMEFSPSGMAIKSLEQGMQLATYLVQGKAAPKDWTPAQVFLAMQAGLEHGLGYTGGIQSFVIINNMPSWRGQAAVGKIRASRVLEPGTLDFGCEDDPERPGQLRGWAKARRVGDHKDTFRYFTQQEALEAGLWSAGNNWTKFKRRMLMWRAVGFLTKDLFSDVLGNFPIAEELLFRGTPEDDIDRIPAKAISQLTGAVDAPANDPLLDELSPSSPPVILDEASDVPLEVIEATDRAQAIENAASPPGVGPSATAQVIAEQNEGRFRNFLADMEDCEDFADLERRTYRALTAAGENKAWQGEVKALSKKLLKKFPAPSDNTRG